MQIDVLLLIFEVIVIYELYRWLIGYFVRAGKVYLYKVRKQRRLMGNKRSAAVADLSD